MSIEEQLLDFLNTRPPAVPATTTNPYRVPPTPPTVPTHLASLTPDAYTAIALQYLETYPFDRPFLRGKVLKVPTELWPKKARSYLRACILVDRSGLSSIGGAIYNPTLEQQRFIHQVIYKRRWTLEELASEIIALVELGTFLSHLSSRCLMFGQ